MNLWIINNVFTAIRVVWVSGGLGKSSNINEVIRSVFFFFTKRFHQCKKAQNIKNVYKKTSK